MKTTLPKLFTLFLLCLASSGILSAQQPEASPAPTIKTTANLVVVDVVVRDAQGHPIHGLKQQDFAVTEDKAPQTLRNFEERVPDETQTSTFKPKLPPGVFTNDEPGGGSGPVNILLLDEFTTQPSDQTNVRNQLLKFIDNAKPGTRMALLQLDSHLKILQGVTDNKQLLISTLQERNTGVLYPRRDRGCTDQLALSQTTLNTMNFLSLYLGNLPGRKNLLWFGGGFAFQLLENDNTCYVTADDFREATLKLGSMQVSIYPMKESVGFVGPPPDNLKEWARLTGGRAYSNANDIGGETAAAIDDGSSYYTLSYVPQNKNEDGNYRTIKITLTNGTRAELSYRQGYFAGGSPHKTAIFGKAKADPRQAPRPSSMQMALMLGTPSATQVTFLTHILPVSGKEEPAPAAGNDVAPGVKGPYLRYAVRLSANISTLHPTEDADGTRHFSFEFVTMVYNLKGDAVNSVGSTGRIDMPPAAYERALKEGLSLQSEVSVPSNGDYSLRVAVHDVSNDHVGSVEVPLSAVKNLPLAGPPR